MKSPQQHNYQTLEHIAKLCKIVTNPRRIYVIETLLNNHPIDKRELSQIVAEAENGPNWTAQDRKRTYIALHQVHLQKLEDENIIELKPDGNVDRGRNYQSIWIFTKTILSAYHSHL